MGVNFFLSTVQYAPGWNVEKLKVKTMYVWDHPDCFLGNF